jgi:TRAP-type C4-dicarboxylate transport system substrate-binding protein
MNYGEVYSALQQGVIDGGEANVIGFVNDRFFEVGKYFSFTSITYNPITLLINEQFFQSLPESVREDVVACARKALAYQSEVARELERKALETMRKEEVVISYPDLEQLSALVRPKVWEALRVRLPDGENLLKRLEQSFEETSVE